MENKAIQESNLVRLTIDALQGMHSALQRMEMISTKFSTQSADRTSNKISSPWNRFSSTHALGAILKAIMHTGSLVFLLRKFVEHFKKLNIDEFPSEVAAKVSETSFSRGRPPYSQVNHAFVVAVAKVLEGYVCALDTVHASVSFRRSASISSESYLTTVAQSELTFLDVYLHTRGLSTQIEALGHICDLHDLAACSTYLHDEVPSEVSQKFNEFHKGADLLSYLYKQIRDSDPAHCGLFKFLFLHSWEPYCELVRSWIFGAEVADPFEEFLIEEPNAPPLPDCEHEKFSKFSFAKLRETAAVPCFLSDSVVLIVRTGQQLQVLKQLHMACDRGLSGCYQQFFPNWSQYAGDLFLGNQLNFSRSHVNALTIARKDFYSKMVERANDICGNLTQMDEMVLNYSATYPTMNKFGSFASSPPPKNCFKLLSHDETVDDEISDYSSWSDSEDLCNVEDPTRCFDTSISCDHDALSYLEFLCHSSNCKRESKVSRTSEIADSDVPRNTFGHADSMNLGMSCSQQSALGPKSITLAHVSELNDGARLLEISEDAINDGSFYFHTKLNRHRSKNVFLEKPNPYTEDGSRLNPSLFKIFWNDYLFSVPTKVTEYGVMLSVNPMLRRSAFYDASNPGANLAIRSKPMLPCYEFSSVEDPLGIFCCTRSRYSAHDFNAATLSDSSRPCFINDDNKQENTATIVIDSSPLESIKINQGIGMQQDGDARSWESLLCGRKFSKERNNRGYWQSISGMSDFPLDTVIGKCILQEIFLQYCYVSRLSLKVLEEGFDLPGHFLALRRYYFMEVADWVDIFVASLWGQKWHDLENEQVVSVLQRLLTSSIQRSSCEKDPQREHLFIIVKDCIIERTPSAIGVGSFDFFSLDYKVNWPLNIVLTTTALEIYAKIFSFLIKVKLSAFALTSVWKLLKEMRNLVSTRNHRCRRGFQIFNMLIQIRHQLNHFVTALQQYLQSQLSQVSWCQFIDFLHQKVKDMMDLEYAHLAYLSDSENKCFLSDATRPVASIIEAILQCCIDFQQCVAQFMHKLSPDGEPNLWPSEPSISRALDVRHKFEGKMKELRECQRWRKDENRELHCFWECVSSNEFYSDIFTSSHL